MKIVTVVPVKEIPKEDGPEKVIYMPNEPGRENLCQKLNAALQGAKEVNADWLCFHHDDLTIQTPELVEQNLRRAEADRARVCGVIGALTAWVPAWWQNRRPLHTFGAIVQGYHDGREQVMADQPGYNPNLALVDGCILWIHRDMFDVRINDYGNHLYDSDICFRALQNGFKVACLDVRCKHQSEGGYEFKEYQGVTDKFMEYWRARAEFPIISGQKFKEVKE